MQAVGIGLWVEEHRDELVAAWRKAVADGEGSGREPGLAFALAPLLRQMALDLSGEAEALRATRPGAGLGRCAVLVRSSAAPAQLAREFKLLRREIWDAMRRDGSPVGQDERRALDEWLDEALEAALARLERVRLRVEAFERGPAVIPGRPGAPMAAPQAMAPAKSPARPPPLPTHRPPALPLSSIRPTAQPRPGANGVSHGPTWER